MFYTARAPLPPAYKSLPNTPRYKQVVSSDEVTDIPNSRIREMNGQTEDINRGFGGK
jgi:hypothetical protein